MKIYYRKTRQILKSRFVVRSENDCSLSSRQSCLLQIIFKGIRLILMGWNGSPLADLEEVVTAIFAVHSISLHFFLLQGILVNPCSSASPSVPWNDNCGKLALGHSHILIWRGKDLHLYTAPASLCCSRNHLPSSFLGGIQGGCELLPLCAFLREPRACYHSSRQVLSLKCLGMCIPIVGCVYMQYISNNKR